MKLKSAILAIALLAGAAIAPAAHAESASTEVALVDAFFEALAAEDLARLGTLIASEAEAVLPYNPNGDTSDAGIRRFPLTGYLSGASRVYDGLTFVDREVTRAERGVVWVEAEGRLTVAANGNPYTNRYVFKFEVNGGQITRLTEYTNTVTLARDGVAARAPQKAQ